MYPSNGPEVEYFYQTKATKPILYQNPAQNPSLLKSWLPNHHNPVKFTPNRERISLQIKGSS